MKRVAWGALAFIGVICSEAWAADFVSLDGFSPTYVLIGGPLTVPYGRLDNDIVRGAFNYRIAP